MSDLARLSVNMDEITAGTLRDLMRRDGTTATEIVRRAIGVYRHLCDAQDIGQTIQTVTRNGAVTEVEILR